MCGPAAGGRGAVTRMEWIYRQINRLSTPCGEISVVDGQGRKCRFSVRNNPYQTDYRLFCGTGRERVLHTETNFLLCVPASELRLGETCQVRLTGTRLGFGGSDEHTEAVSGSANGCSIAIGAYDPNDDEKQRQAYEYSQQQGFLARRMILPPPQYDKSRFVGYEVDMLEDYSGFRFRRLEKTVQEICFTVAWVACEPEHCTEYEAAVEFWTT